jgi:hypothetical protein
MGEAFKTACTRIEARPTVLSKTTRGPTSCYPSPRISVLRECSVLARAHLCAGASI